jgi:hypothetical protein
MMPRHLPSLVALLLIAPLSGCMTSRGVPDRTAFEAFDSSSTYSRAYDHSPRQACEAARRALLSQGFVVGRAESDIVEARKYFQQDERHEQVEFRAVCMPQMRGEHQTMVFVNAVQDRYALRKSNTSASLGVSALGSVSLPIGSSEDSLVKVASETLQDDVFYKRFFSVLERFLPEQVERPAPALPAVQPTLFPVPAYPAPEPAPLPEEPAPSEPAPLPAPLPAPPPAG